MCSTGGNGDLDTVQMRHDLFVKEVQRGEDHTVREVSFVEHTHEVISADLPHLLTELAGDRVCSGASLFHGGGKECPFWPGSEL